MEDTFHNLEKLKDILHQIKLAILLILSKNVKEEASIIRRLLDIPWGTFGTHVEKLIKEGYIGSTREFVNGNPRIVLYITNKGENALDRLSSQFENL